MTVLLYILGVLFVALGVGLSIGLHEIGHLVPAKKFGVKVTYATQVVQDGTGRVVELARDFAGNDPFVLSYGDILINAENYVRLVQLGGAEAIVSVPFDCE